MLINKFLKLVKQDKFWIIFFGSLFAIIVAYAFEFIGKFKPCALCILQRIPYFALQCIALIAVIWPKQRRCMSYMVAIMALFEVALAAYHVGIEHYIFDESSTCRAIDSGCSTVYFRIMNLSMAEWNLIYIIALLYYFIKLERKNGLFTRRS